MTWLERSMGVPPYEDFLGVKMGGWLSDEEGREELYEHHLTLIGEVDLTEPDYSFDLIRFWVRKRDGMVLYSTDSGCSCPSPFEETALGDLKETTLARVVDVVRTNATGRRPTSAVVADAIALIPAMQKAGAR